MTEPSGYILHEDFSYTTPEGNHVAPYRCERCQAVLMPEFPDPGDSGACWTLHRVDECIVALGLRVSRLEQREEPPF